MLRDIEAIDAELERIVSSREFSSSPRLVAFLRYSVEQSREGRFDSLKESVIGVKVFDRTPGYDPKIDPIVRVHARRLREKLEAFYDSERPLEIVIQMPKGGYVSRFEEVPRHTRTEIIPVELTTAGNSDRPRPLAANKFGRLPISIGIAALLSALGTLGWRASREDFSEAVAQPLVSLPGSANDPAWAPDGKSIAFTWDGGGAGASFVYLLKNGESTPGKLTATTDPEYRPVWSSDGSRIALLRHVTRNQFALVLVQTATKKEQVIRTVERPASVLIPPALDWSSNGEWLVTSEMSAEGGGPAHLLLVSAKDGRSWVITDPPNGSTGDLEARFTPDGKRIVFRRGGHGELFMVSLARTASSAPVEITHHNAGVRGVSVWRDGKTIYFGSQQEYGRFGIWRIREGEPAPSRITPQDTAAVSPAIDPSGRNLAFVEPVVDLNLWLYSGHPSRETRLLAPSTQAEYSPAFSPDGGKVAFISDRSGTPNVWISALDGGQPRQVTSLHAGDHLMHPAWSPDSKRIAYFCRRSGWNYAFETNIATGTTRTLRAGQDYSLAPQYSSDGNSLYYVSNAGHRFRVWRQSLIGRGDAVPVSAEEVSFFRISKDRRYLYFVPLDRTGRLIQLDLATKEERTRWTFADSLGAFDAWDVAGATLYYIKLEPARSAPVLVAVDLDTGEPREIATLRKLSGEWKNSIGASPDGQQVVVTQADMDESRLMLLHLPAPAQR